jgi:hypothetical protein
MASRSMDCNDPNDLLQLAAQKQQHLLLEHLWARAASTSMARRATTDVEQADIIWQCIRVFDKLCEEGSQHVTKQYRSTCE